MEQMWHKQKIEMQQEVSYDQNTNVSISKLGISINFLRLLPTIHDVKLLIPCIGINTFYHFWYAVVNVLGEPKMRFQLTTNILGK